MLLANASGALVNATLAAANASAAVAPHETALVVRAAGLLEEGHGVEPDIRIDNPPAAAHQGHEQGTVGRECNDNGDIRATPGATTTTWSYDWGER